jgi:nucleoid DNA-binding protein
MNKKGVAEAAHFEAKLNSEAMALAEQTALVQMDSRKLTQVITTALGIATSMVSSFTEDPPDFEYAFDSMNLQGWKLIKLVVPEDRHKTPEFKSAGKAWKAAFQDAGEITEELIEASKKKDVRAIVDSVLRIVGKALETTAAAVQQDGDLILAINDLVQGMAKSVLDFVSANDWFPPVEGSFVQAMESDPVVVAAMEPAKLTSLLTTGVGIVTTFVSAFTEDPPDFEYAFDAMNIQGWKIVKLLVPEEDQKKKSFKNAQKAWKRVFSEAAGLVEDVMQASKGDTAALVNSVLKTVDTALKTAADVVDPDTAKILESVGTLVVGIGEEWVTFSQRVGWLS